MINTLEMNAATTITPKPKARVWSFLDVTARREAEKVFLEELMPSEDVREGIASFFEKRKPVWKNR